MKNKLIKMDVTLELASDVGTLIREKEKLIDELDHIIKKGLYKRVKSEECSENSKQQFFINPFNP
ncbi:MAG: hypothetical protein CVT88_07640 [Candidatus Altiarchaeales archaeon HGW-Altiarchaeales-1]|nr:MAG: hypothetical protein CVT88_07640 [Candidatus Altiarchaeales archaeon HGW-Altiarchaeales-1]